MILLNDIIISRALFERQFVCKLDKCKGACCVKGDFGAPLEDEEIETLEEILPHLETYLTDSGLQAIDKQGVASEYYDDSEDRRFMGTTLREDGACAFVHIGNDGIASCAIENAWADGVHDFRKPLSCHLYPVRLLKMGATGTEALNYDEWEICSPACANGRDLGVPLYRFVGEALVRRYGEGFVQQLDEIYRDMSEGKVTDI